METTGDDSANPRCSLTIVSKSQSCEDWSDKPGVGPFSIDFSLERLSGMWCKAHWQETRGRNRQSSKSARGFPRLPRSVSEKKGIIQFQGIIKFLILEGHYHTPTPEPDLTPLITRHPAGYSLVAEDSHVPSFLHSIIARAQWSWAMLWQPTWARWEGHKQWPTRHNQRYCCPWGRAKEEQQN